MATDIKIPDIGDFGDVEIVEITVTIGDKISKDDPILMLESDKATLDIPSPFDGIVAEILVQEGDRVSEGSLVLRMDISGDVASTTETSAQSSATPAPSTSSTASVKSENHSEILVIGAGPGGYTAAFRAADLGKKVTLVDPRATLGGVCLNVGCIPSKALLHIAKVKDEAEHAKSLGLGFSDPKVDLEKVRGFKSSVVARLTGGLSGLAKKRKVTVIRGTARFTGSNSVAITSDTGEIEQSFDKAIISVGSEPVSLPFLPEDPRIMDSTGALELDEIPKRLLVIGGGIIGLEMAQVYHSLGSNVQVVEMADQIIPGADKDIVTPLAKRIDKIYEAIHTKTRVTKVEASESLKVTLESESETTIKEFDRILVAVGRTPNGNKISAEEAGVTVEPTGFIPVNDQMQTEQSHIFAIGDVVGQPMLAHKAVHEGKTAAEAATGEKVAFDPKCIPSVAYTDPEVAWTGLTEKDAKEAGQKVKSSTFPWMASGRALSLDRDEGLTKLIFDPETGQVLGAGIVGQNAGDLIAEVSLAIEMGADAEDLGLTIHPHPTLSETVALSAEMFSGTITDL